MKGKMKRISLFILLIILVSPFLFYLEWVVGGYPWEKNRMENDLQNHLASIDYKPEDIQELKTGYNRKLGEYGAQVIFRDEKDNIYYYHYIKNQIRQIGITSSDHKKAKHLEK